MIRWDQTGIVRKPDGSQLVNLDLTTDGLIELSAANPSFVLEHGVQATLTVRQEGRLIAATTGVLRPGPRMPTSNGSMWRLHWGCTTTIVISRSLRPMEKFTTAEPCFLRSRS